MLPRDEFRRLLIRARAGSKEAWGELVLAWHPHLLRVAQKMAAQPEIGKDRPSDVVQTAMVRALEKIAQFHGQTIAEFHAWLGAIIDSTFNNHLRQAARWHASDEIEALPAPAAPAATGRADEILECLQRHLSDEEVMVVGLWLDGWTWQEIGAKVAMTPDAARMLKERAMPHLADSFIDQVLGGG